MINVMILKEREWKVAKGAYYEKCESWITLPPSRQNAFQPKGIFLFQYEKNSHRYE